MANSGADLYLLHVQSSREDVPCQICSSFVLLFAEYIVVTKFPSFLERLFGIITARKSSAHSATYPRDMKEEFLLFITHAFPKSCSFGSDSSHS